MLPAVTRPESPITGDERTMPTVWLESLGRRGPVPRMTFMEWNRCAQVLVGNFDDFDDPQVSSAMADVELCMRREPMPLRWTRIDGRADPARQHIDGSVGG
jgi:hypothetical protein